MTLLSSLRKKLARLVQGEEGVSSIEYVVLAAIIIAALAFFGGGLKTAFQTSSSHINTAITNPTLSQ
jgi:Flp pilus assembly pilin Flp